MDMENYFKGKNINLIAFEKYHIEMVASWINDERISFGNGPRFPISKYEQNIWYENICKDKTKKKLIISKEKENIGMISLFNIDHINKNSEIGIYIIPEYQGQGYAKESLYLLLKFVFYELNMHKVYASILDFNVLSIGLFESVGFTCEGTNKEATYSMGKFVDIKIYSLFKRNFIKDRNLSCE